jgi:hypothetical protein
MDAHERVIDFVLITLLKTIHYLTSGLI